MSMPPGLGCENTGGQNTAMVVNEANASRQKKKDAPSAMWDADVEVLKEVAKQVIMGILEQKETRSVRFVADVFPSFADCSRSCTIVSCREAYCGGELSDNWQLHKRW